MGVAGVDTRIQANALDAPSNGVLVGFYHLLRPEHDGAPQAEHFLDTVDRFVYSMPLAVDVELDNGQTPARVADVLRDFVLRLTEATGRLPAIYTGVWFWNPNVGSQHDSLFAQCPLWVAEYGVQTPSRLPRGFSSYWLHQYTSTGVVAGISGDVDLNRPKDASFRLALPVDSPARITQVYGANYDYYMTNFGLPGHEGIDYGGADGANIYAVADGTVKLIARDNGIHPYGNQIRLIHTGGYESIYAHLRGFVPELLQGDAVRQGQVIGYLGSTGNSTGPHLHFTLKHNGQIVDPTPYLP